MFRSLMLLITPLIMIVHIVKDKSLTVTDGWKVERWTGSMFMTENFAESNMRAATTQEVASMGASK